MVGIMMVSCYYQVSLDIKQINVLIYYIYGKQHFFIRFWFIKQLYTSRKNIKLINLSIKNIILWYSKDIGKYLFVPLINKGKAYLSKGEFKLVVISTICTFIFWRDYKNPYQDLFQLYNRMSMIWLSTFNLTEAYIGKYQNYYPGYKKLYIVWFV